MEFNFNYTNPEFISAGDTADTMKITFKNTKTFLQPEVDGLQPIPDGYTMTFPIPPQGGAVALS